MTINAAPAEKMIIKNQVEVLSLAEGFFQSSVLFALLRLKIFERLGEAEKTVETLAAEINAPPETLARVLNAGVMLKLLETAESGAYRVAPMCRTVLLPAAGENYLGNWIRLMDEFSGVLSKLDQAVLKSGPMIAPEVYLGADPERTRRYILAMHNYASLRGKELTHYLDTSQCKSLLDLGCGSGAFAFHLGMKNPNLRLYLSDLPEVLEVTRTVQARYYLQNEVIYLPLDAAKDEIPGSYDLILASNVIQCFDQPTRTKLLQRLHRAINPGGSLVIQAQYLQENRTGGRWAVYVDLNLLCTTQTGRNHTPAETKQWLEEIGFANIEYNPMSIYGTTSFVRGYKKL
jgi:SAM-dependent methyltransferase